MDDTQLALLEHGILVLKLNSKGKSVPKKNINRMFNLVSLSTYSTFNLFHTVPLEIKRDYPIIRSLYLEFRMKQLLKTLRPYVKDK